MTTVHDVKLTDRQQAFLDDVVHHGGRMFSGHDRRAAEALARKDLLSVSVPRTGTLARWFTPTDLGRHNATQARFRRRYGVTS